MRSRGAVKSLACLGLVMLATVTAISCQPKPEGQQGAGRSPVSVDHHPPARMSEP